jgi:hypothetical protein
MTKKIILLTAVLLVSAGLANAASFFTENFSGLAMPANMESVLPAASLDGTNHISFAAGNAVWNSSENRQYIRTIESDYFLINFRFEATITVSGGPWGGSFFGMGAGNANTGNFGEPTSPNIMCVVWPTSFLSGGLDGRDNSAAVWLANGAAGDGTHRLRMDWNATTKIAAISIDKNYTGGAFVADATGTLNGADNGFNATNSHIVFGGGENMIVDDIAVSSLETESSVRETISLDGSWQIEQGSNTQVPASFTHTVIVPGIVDLANPAFTEVGQESSQREAFWYRKTFVVQSAIPKTAYLKIHKAAYGVKVYLNGTEVGSSYACFTPIYVDVSGYLLGNGVTNVLLIRTGAYRTSLPNTVPDGFDFEKTRYSPGIYDSVELILSETPHIINVQTAPDLVNSRLRVQALIKNDNNYSVVTSLDCKIYEKNSNNLVSTHNLSSVSIPANSQVTAVFFISIPNYHAWSPEDPFLYRLHIATPTDDTSVIFGMRTFRFDASTRVAKLNEQTRYLKGTNICIFRFFEDPLCGDLPWNEQWVRDLHRKFKSMGWDTIRYCIGFPPEFWYRIADEEGLLIQDEFPVWYFSSFPSTLSSSRLIGDYTDWMKERWNHPCVVIWDAQNETITSITGTAIQAVHGLDLSNRPWNNGWSPTQAAGDCRESHPYKFNQANFAIQDLASISRVPQDGNPIQNDGTEPVIINEYDWLWLNRDGTPTTLTNSFYQAFVDVTTTQQRRELHSRYVAMLTEFWRSYRQVAGVLHFCGLGYSRPSGQTSDDFIDLQNLVLEPNFESLVKDAFAPVGVMIEAWPDGDYRSGTLPSGNNVFPVIIINDLGQPWEGQLGLKLFQNGQLISEVSSNCSVPALGRITITPAIAYPTAGGSYKLEAVLSNLTYGPVKSIRKFSILSDCQYYNKYGNAGGKSVTASSVYQNDNTLYGASYVTDGKGITRWSSSFSEPQWIKVDLGVTQSIERVDIDWESAYARSFEIQVSTNGSTWNTVYHTDSGIGGHQVIKFAPVNARWVRMYGITRATTFGFSIFEFRIYFTGFEVTADITGDCQVNVEDFGCMAGQWLLQDCYTENDVIGKWSFDADASDSSGNGHNGTFVGDAHIVTDAARGQVLYLDGASDYVDIPINVSETDFALSLWFKTFVSNRGIFEVRNSDGSAWDRDIYLSGNNVAAYLWTGTSGETLVTSSGSYANNAWHHLVYVFGGNSGPQRLYIDGQLRASGTASSSAFTGDTKMLIGYSKQATSPAFAGWIDDVELLSGLNSCEADFNFDLNIDFNDLLIFAGHWLN